MTSHLIDPAFRSSHWSDNRDVRHADFVGYPANLKAGYQTVS